MLMHKISTRVAVADADLQIKGGGGVGVIQPWDPGIRGEGGARLQKIFSALWASVWSKNKGGVGPPGPLTWIRHLVVCVSSKHPRVFKYP